jgi:hypothetical protein
MPSSLARILAALVAGAVALAISRSFGVIPSTLLSSLLIAGGSLIIGRPTIAEAPRWALLGATTGALMGTAKVLAHRLQGMPLEAGATQRAVVMALLASAGVVGGIVLSRDAARADRRHPRDVLRTISGLTTGLFATLVALAYFHQGLDPARAISSRLSTALTIVVATLTVPGWLAHVLAHPGWRGPKASPTRPHNRAAHNTMDHRDA